MMNKGQLSFDSGYKQYELSNHLPHEIAKQQFHRNCISRGKGNFNGCLTLVKSYYSHESRSKYNEASGVLVTIQDRKWGIQTTASNNANYYLPYIVTTTDYYAFGSRMLERSQSFGVTYKFGFNNQEREVELGEYYSFEHRMNDSRLGRFLSVDKHASSYPGLSCYSICNNNPIYNSEVDGNDFIYFMYLAQNEKGNVGIINERKEKSRENLQAIYDSHFNGLVEVKFTQKTTDKDLVTAETIEFNIDLQFNEAKIKEKAIEELKNEDGGKRGENYNPSDEAVNNRVKTIKDKISKDVSYSTTKSEIINNANRHVRISDGPQDVFVAKTGKSGEIELDLNQIKNISGSDFKFESSSFGYLFYYHEIIEAGMESFPEADNGADVPGFNPKFYDIYVYSHYKALINQASAIGASFCINRANLENKKIINDGSYMSLMFFKVINNQVYEMTVSVHCTLNDQTNQLDMSMTVGDDGKGKWTKTVFGIGSTVNDMTRSPLEKPTIQYFKNKELQILKDTHKK